MRRHCEACDRDYKHDEVIASGNDGTGSRRHFVGCSFECLVTLLRSAGAQLTGVHEPQYG